MGIALLDDVGYTAEVEEDDWPVMGAPVLVRKSGNPTGPWAGRLLAFRPAQRIVWEWVLASGETRQAVERRHVGPAGQLGQSQSMRWIGRQYEATVVEAAPAVRVTVEFIIKAGPRRRDLYFDGGLPGYFRPEGGGAELVRLVPL